MEPIITCVERLYKVQGQNATYFVKAKTELSQDVTDKLLQEDMELKTFLQNYEITNINLSYRTNKTGDEQDKIIRMPVGGLKSSKNPEEGKDNEKRPPLAGRLTQVQRLWIIINELSEWFGMKDFIDAVEKRGYSYDDSFKMWKSTWTYLSKNKKIERTKGNTSSRKYRYIKDITPSSMVEKDLKNLKEGNKVILNSFLK